MKTIHEIINGTAVSLSGNADIVEMRKILKQYAAALKGVIPPTAIICDTRDSVVISRETAYAAECATDRMAHTYGLREKTTAMYNRAQHELYNTLKESAEMGTEKMDSCIGFGQIGGYPVCVETISNSMKPLSLAESHLTRVLSELWDIYERESDGQSKFTMLCEISRAARALHNMKGE